jgi:hypothetical protein
MPFKNIEEQRKYCSNPKYKKIQKEYHKEYYARPEIKEKRREYNKERQSTLLYKEHRKAYMKKYHGEPGHQESNKHYQFIRIRKYKIKAIETIAAYYNIEVKCWRCGETRLWVLSIGHPDKNGKEDRQTNGTGTKFYKMIFEGKRDCKDLKIECINCNYCLKWYGRYPDEMSEEEFRLMSSG